MLKIIKYNNANAIEATWYDVITPETVDDEGKVTPEVIKQLRSHAYADVQMQMFRDDVVNFGGNIADHEALIAEIESKSTPVPPATVVIPTTVPMRQARLALLQAGLLSTVNAAINLGSEADKIEWEYATVVVRDSPLVSGMATALNLTDVQLDSLFLLAESL